MISVKNKIMLVLALTVLGGVGYLLFFSSWAQVQAIHVEGARAVSSEQIERVVREEMASRVFGVLPRNTGILFPKATVLASLQHSFPRIKDVYLSAKFPEEISIHITEREVEGMWCNLGSERMCAFFDDTGVIFEYAPKTTRGFLFFQVVEQRTEGEILKLGTQALDQELYSFLSFLREGIALRELPALRYRIVSDEEIRVEFQGGWEAFFSRDDNPVYQVEVLHRVLTKEIEDDLPFLDYIDLRVKNKVFYSLDK